MLIPLFGPLLRVHLWISCTYIPLCTFTHLPYHPQSFGCIYTHPFLDPSASSSCHSIACTSTHPYVHFPCACKSPSHPLSSWGSACLHPPSRVHIIHCPCIQSNRSQ
ncbi:hypothetical protein B0H10DRAFT_361648 [Mycena sp. CBHHK59/15]|nr:hypothetical protein B0H10DRAFT_676807 [Mycena sp. CBHHK59/15]KAJ6611458.1 hypothetical protein B0H10DRAFT_361648 [Mycena sp. CBHHK59/15]